MSKTMKKHIAWLCVLCLMAALLCSSALAVNGEASAEYREIPLYVDGIRAGSGYMTEGTTYIPLRAFLEALQLDAEIHWDHENGMAVITMEELELSVGAEAEYMCANGRYFYIDGGAHNLNGTIMVPIRELAKIFGVTVEWSSEYWTMNIDSGSVDVIEMDEDYYNEDDLYWLSRIIYAESGNQPLAGQIGVGNVVLNRVADETCPDTIYDVIFDTKHGVQFSPVASGTIYNTPDEEAVIAAKLVLEGYVTVGESIFFVNPVIGAGSWFANHRTFITAIGDHYFYA